MQKTQNEFTEFRTFQRSWPLKNRKNRPRISRILKSASVAIVCPNAFASNTNMRWNRTWDGNFLHFKRNIHIEISSVIETPRQADNVSVTDISIFFKRQKITRYRTEKAYQFSHFLGKSEYNRSMYWGLCAKCNSQWFHCSEFWWNRQFLFRRIDSQCGRGHLLCNLERCVKTNAQDTVGMPSHEITSPESR